MRMKMGSQLRPATLAATATLLTLFVVFGAWGAGEHDHGSHQHGKKDSTDPKKITHLFGNHKCPVTGDTVVPESFVEAKYKDEQLVGRIYLCCDGCIKKVKKKFGEQYNKHYRTNPKTGKAVDPVDLMNATCPISGDPITKDDWIEYNGMIVRFCCADCVDEFLEEPNSRLMKLVPNAKKFKYKRPAGSGSSK